METLVENNCTDKNDHESCYHRIKHQKIQDYKYCFTHVKEAAAGGVL